MENVYRSLCCDITINLWLYIYICFATVVLTIKRRAARCKNNQPLEDGNDSTWFVSAQTRHRNGAVAGHKTAEKS